MSRKVKARIDMMMKERKLYRKAVYMPNHEERMEIDKQIEAITGKDCDRGVAELSDEELWAIIQKVKKRKRKLPIYCV